jgi:hypothetical protein
MKPALLCLLVVLAATADAFPQSAASFDRLPTHLFDVLAPSARVAGDPGAMAIRQTGCKVIPAAQVRRRIVELAVQEWGFFGFTVVDQTEVGDEDFQPRRSRRPGDALSARVAASIAGYWAVTPSGSWILESQNKIWNGVDGVSARWRFPWSAAFVSWVMCESGLAAPDQFQRAIAHHVYIDQAIRARDQNLSRTAFAAYDPGEAVLAPGDLLCTSRRPAYRSLSQRRSQLGQGARTHCDIVVKVDRGGRRLLAIGGNVRGSVSLKVVPLSDEAGTIRLADPDLGGRTVFAHLKLRADYASAEAFETSPTIKALGCAGAGAEAARRAASNVVGAAQLRCLTSAAP